MIKRVSINNFKCFLKETVSLSQLTVLAGINGVGKSTVIQAIILLQQALEAVKFNRKKLLLNNKYINLVNSKKITSYLTDKDNIDFEIIKSKEQEKENKIFVKLQADQYQPNNYISLITHSALDIITGYIKMPFYYLMAERLGPRDFQAYATNENDVGTRGEFTGYVINRNDRFKVNPKRAIKKGKQDSYLLKPQIENWMDMIIPGIKLNTEINEKSNIVSLEYGHLKFETDFLQPSNIGFGVTYVLPIIVAALIAPEGSILIVENPEAHLHPSGQSRIGSFLATVANTGVQIILETHSEHVINGIRLAVLKENINYKDILFNFFKQDPKLSVPVLSPIKLNADAELMEWPADFFDQEEQDLALMFHLRKDKRK